jgi:hypothetical protein
VWAVRYLRWLAAIALVGLTGCASVGPKKLVPTHEGYNDAVQLAVSREVLKNIVRERYLEPPQDQPHQRLRVLRDGEVVRRPRAPESPTVI